LSIISFKVGITSNMHKRNYSETGSITLVTVTGISY